MTPRLTIFATLVIALLAMPQTHHAQGPGAHGPAKHGNTGAGGIGTMSNLPALGSNSEALAVNGPGTVIVGQAFDRHGLLYPIRWTQQNGAWVREDLLWPADAVSATARAVNSVGAAAGNDFHRSPDPSVPPPPSHVVFWPPATTSPTILGCGEVGSPGNVFAMSANAQIVVGTFADAQTHVGAAAVWQPGGCLSTLPPLLPDVATSAAAVNGDATVVGGLAWISADDAVPVRWHSVAGVWQIEQLDTRDGYVFGANAAGDLVGSVEPCGTNQDCAQAVIWDAAGGVPELGTLGGATSAGIAINSSGEVVGLSTLASGNSVGFFWSDSTGMVQLSGGSGVYPFGLSDVRPDGTRLVVGVSARASAAVWVVRVP